MKVKQGSAEKRAIEDQARGTGEAAAVTALARAEGARCDGDPRPLSWRELRDCAGTVEPAAPVPEHLRGLWADLSDDRPAARVALRRKAAGPPGSVGACRPPWTGAAVKPRSAGRLVAPRLRYRGREFDPLVVWGADERRIYNDIRYPWGCVCRVVSGGQGSGVIVGPRHVLTASHCLDWDRRVATVEVHAFGPTVAATARAVAVHYYEKISDGVGWSEVDEDYAVIVTDQRIGDRFGWMGTRTYDSGWDGEDHWFNIGYPTDLGAGLYPVWQRDQNLDEDEWDYGSARAMTTSADVMKGQSGGPLFGFWDEGGELIPYVVAVVSATGAFAASGTENWCSGGSDLTQLVINARAEDP